MAELNKKEMINNYKSILIDKEYNYLSRLELGFINDNCAIQTFNILIHCVENIEIFNNRQVNDITNHINKLSYV